MSIRLAVRDFVELGPFPPEAFYGEEVSDDEAEIRQADLEERQRRLELIIAPVTDDEVRLLLRSFGEGGCFGLAWSLLHLIETAPSPAIVTEPTERDNEWIVLLWHRASGEMAP